MLFTVLIKTRGYLKVSSYRTRKLREERKAIMIAVTCRRKARCVAPVH
jgi:hypothetical protein